jgi:hypothetical protein
MAGRRRSERFRPAGPWDGRLRVLRDVHVQEESDGRLVALGHAPGVVGEELRLDLAGGGHALTLTVRVVECRPVILGGALLHQVELEVVGRQAMSVDPAAEPLPLAASGGGR